MKQYLFLLAILLILAACNSNTTDTSTASAATETAPPLIGYSVINTYPHDTGFYTEGLEFHDGQLYESSGAGSADAAGAKPYPSAFGIVNLKTGKVDRKVTLDNTQYFGEGITIMNGKIYQLTWQNHKGYIYDARSFKKLQEFSYPGEGWSLTHDSTNLIMSDGSSNLQFIAPASIGATLKPGSIVGVTDNNGPVSNINELEYAKGYIYANQYTTNYILKIDPSNGKVVGKLDLSSLEAEAKKKYSNTEYLNGIAYKPETNTLYVTGKLWPTIYEIRLN